MINKFLTFITILALAGCGSFDKDRGSSGVYAPDQTMREQTVRQGVVETVREVEIKKDVGALSVGSAVGAAVGAVVAHDNVGKGRGSDVAGVLGAVGGSLLGQVVEEQMSKKKAVELTIKLSTGEIIAITQEANGETFRPGDKVRVLSGGGATRVTRE